MSSKRTPHSAARPLPAFAEATVADVMRPGVMSCPPNTSLGTVAQMMTAHTVHAIVVSGVTSELIAGDQLAWGMLSDMDLIRAVVAGTDGHAAREIARTEAVDIEPSAPLVNAAALMVKHGTAHLVVAGEGRPMGMLSTLDLAASLAVGGR